MRKTDPARAIAADLPRLEQIDSLTEYLAEIGTVDLIDDEQERTFLRGTRGLEQPAGKGARLR